MFDSAKDFLGRKEDGSPFFSDVFLNKLYEVESKFREPIIVELNEQIGTDQWAIYFGEVISTDAFDAHIFCDNVEDYARICSIIGEKIPKLMFNFFYAGTIYDYLRTI